MRGRLLTVGQSLAWLTTTLIVACGHTDPTILTAVDARLAADRVTADLSVDISVTRGVVRLEGETDSAEQRRRAVDIARAVPGVRDVIDAIYPGDAAVVDAVRKALAADPLVGGIPITVSVQRGTVQLVSDQTGKEHRARAVEIASRIPGVTDVEDLMR